MITEKKMKLFDIPEEIRLIHDEYENYMELRELYTKVPFGFKKALKCGKLAEEKRRKFWSDVQELYPELRGKVVNWDMDKLYIVE